METVKNHFNMLVLVPHRDARLPLKAWSASLFAAGLEGAYSFPRVVPLAHLGRSLSAEELKSLAFALRRSLNGECDSHSGGKFTAGDPVSATLPPSLNGVEVFGLGLNTELPVDFFEAVSDAVVCRISPLVLGSGLVHGSAPAGPLAPPATSFRVAALANMDCHFQPFDKGGYSFEWKIGKLHWLPKK